MMLLPLGTHIYICSQPPVHTPIYVHIHNKMLLCRSWSGLRLSAIHLSSISNHIRILLKLNSLLSLPDLRPHYQQDKCRLLSTASSPTDLLHPLFYPCPASQLASTTNGGWALWVLVPFLIHLLGIPKTLYYSGVLPMRSSCSE